MLGYAAAYLPLALVWLSGGWLLWSSTRLNLAPWHLTPSGWGASLTSSHASAVASLLFVWWWSVRLLSTLVVLLAARAALRQPAQAQRLENGKKRISFKNGGGDSTGVGGTGRSNGVAAGALGPVPLGSLALSSLPLAPTAIACLQVLARCLTLLPACLPLGRRCSCRALVPAARSPMI